MSLVPDTAPAPVSDRGAAALFFVLSFATLLLEILLTRIFSVVMWYHFAFFVLSLSLFGIGAGALRYHLRAKPDGPREVGALRSVGYGLAGLGFGAFLPLVLATHLVATPSVSAEGIGLLLLYYVASALPFYFSGQAAAALVHGFPGRLGMLYAFDLVGAGIACAAAVPLLDLLGGESGVLAVVVLAAGAGAGVLARAGDRRGARLGAVGAGVLALLLAANLAFGLLTVQTVKLSRREVLLPTLHTAWNSHSRIVVLDYYDPRRSSNPPFLSWGLSDHYAGPLPRQLLITIDGASETPLSEGAGRVAEHPYLKQDVTALPYVVRPGGEALVIGAGGGRDVMSALAFGAAHVTAVELNSIIVDLVRGRYGEFVAGLYDRPDVEVHVGDGRNFVRSSPRRYDVIQISMIDTFAATAAGAYSLAENNLYTLQAFEEYLDRLKPGGVLCVNRFFLEPPRQTLRVVSIALEALRRRGIADARGHLFVARQPHRLGDNGVVLVKAEPFGHLETEAAQEWCDSLGFTCIYTPGDVAEKGVFPDLICATDRAAWLDAYPFDVRPPTDDWPFFFNTFKLARPGRGLELRERLEAVRVYNYDAVLILAALFALSLVLLALFFWAPLRSAARSGRAGAAPSRGVLAYFAALGVGYIMIEVVLLQRFQLYLGHPTWSLVVTLFALLVFSGFGSALAQRFTGRDGVLPLGRAVAVALAASAVSVLAVPAVMDLVVGSALGVRIATAIALLAVPGLAMGMPFPLGLRMVGGAAPDALPWVWAINAAASVVGSVGAFAAAMAGGFTASHALGALAYALALACHGSVLRWSAERRAAAAAPAATAAPATG